MFHFSRSSATRRRIVTIIAAVALLFPLLLSLSGCAAEPEDTILIEGTWVLQGTGYTEQWVITEDTIEYGDGTTVSYKADIVDFSTSGFNAGDTLIGTYGSAGTNGGFAIIEYTYVDSSWNPSVGDFNVFRWQDNTTDADNRDFTQGYDSTGAYFSSAAAAESGATNSAGFFSYASEGAVLQD